MILGFNHRFGLLRRAWNFPISSALVDSMRSAHDEKTGRVSSLDKSTVDRWANGKPVGKDRPVDDYIEGMARHLSEEGYLKNKLSVEKLVSLFAADDLEFVRFIAGAESRLVPIPAGILQMEAEKADYIEQDFSGRFVMYRLGLVATGRAPFMKVAHPTLRRIPFEVKKGEGSIVGYREYYLAEDNEENIASGFVVRTKDYITIYGEDATRQGRSELFFAFVDLEDKDRKYGFTHGVITMKGDLGVPTAYRVLIKRVSNEDQGTSWEDFTSKYVMSIPLDGDLNPKNVDGVEDEKIIAVCIKYLDTRDTKTDIRI